ncbi:acetylcholine-gated cation-selective channel [Mactra antiquata]
MDLSVLIQTTCILWGLVLMQGGMTSSDNVVSSELYAKLFTNYKTQLIPVCNAGDNVNITFDIALRQIITLDEKDQILTTNVWIRMSWFDCRLKWNTTKYNDVSEMFVPYSEVWTPDLALYDSSAEEVMMPGLPDYRAHLTADGRVRYNFPTVLKSICRVKVTYFPFDTQICKLKFGSWSHSKKDIDFHPADPTKGDLDNFIENNEWIVDGLVPVRDVKEYGNGTEYTEIEYKIIMDRRPDFYVMTMMFPCILVSAIASVGFLLPSESGEKVSLEVTVLLSQAVFLLVISDFLPPSAETFPIIGTYFAVSMLLVCMSLVLSVLVLNIHHRGDINGKIVPRWAKLFVNLVDRCCRYKADYDMKDSDKRNSEIPAKFRNKKSLKETNIDDEPHMNGGDHIKNHRPKTSRHRLPSIQNTSLQDDTMKIYIHEQTETLNNIMHHFEDTDTTEENKEDWQKLARVLDRIFLCLYILCFAIVTLVFILQLKLHETPTH